MAKGRQPSFTVYPKDLEEDDRFARMSNDEFGAWFRLVCKMWFAEQPGVTQDCTVPELARILRCSPQEAERHVRRWLTLGSMHGEIDGTVVRDEAGLQRPDVLKASLANATMTLRSPYLIDVEARRQANADRQQRFRSGQDPPRNAHSNAGCNGNVTRPIPSVQSSIASPSDTRVDARGCSGRRAHKAARLLTKAEISQVLTIRDQTVDRAKAVAAGIAVDWGDKNGNSRNLYLALCDIAARDGLEACRRAAENFADTLATKCSDYRGDSPIHPGHTCWAEWRTRWKVPVPAAGKEAQA